MGQLHRPFGLSLTPRGDIVIADSGNHRVVSYPRDALEGGVVAGGRGQGSRLDQLNYPRGVVAHGCDAVIVADTFNHRVVRWLRGSKRGELIAGGHGRGCRTDQLNRPVGLALDGLGGLLIADSGNHRILRCALSGSRSAGAPLTASVSFKAMDTWAPPLLPPPEEEPWAREVLDTIRRSFHPSKSDMPIDRIFSSLDRIESADNALSLAEFEKLVRTYRPELAGRHVRHLFSLVNLSGSGRISFVEFRRRFASPSDS